MNLLEKTQERSKDIKHFKKFRELSFPEVFSKLNTIKKIKKSVYYKELNTELTLKIPNNIKSLQELLLEHYSIQDTLMSFVLEQLRTYMTLNLFFIKQNATLAENITNIQNHINSGDGENILTIHIIYFMLFQYFHKFEIKSFIPLFIESYYDYKNKYDIKKSIIRAFTFSKLYYLQYGKYLPVIIIIGLGEGCPHAMNIICLPSETKEHDFKSIIIDTSASTKKNNSCKQEFLEIDKEIKAGFKMFSVLFRKKLNLVPTLNRCVDNLQGKYGTCAGYSLGITLNYLFQDNNDFKSVINMCRTLDKKNIDTLNNILLTIGNVSHLFHKFIRDVIIKKVEKKFNKALKIFYDRGNIILEIYNADQENEDTKLQLPKTEAIKIRQQVNQQKFNDNRKKIYDKIINILINLEKNKDQKTLKTISNFLKQCGKTLYKWDLSVITKNKLQ